MKVFTEKDIGCIIDGAHGTKYRRDKLIMLLELSLGSDNNICQKLTKELIQEPSDDFSEEDEAIEILQENTKEGLIWMMNEGDLLLVKEGDQNDAP